MSTIIDLIFFAINHTTFPLTLYILPPTINNIYHFLFISLFLITVKIRQHELISCISTPSLYIDTKRRLTYHLLAVSLHKLKLEACTIVFI